MTLELYGSKSYCHQRPSLIVRSREGGFVTQNCVECGRPRALPFSELPGLQCALCKKDLRPYIDEDNNYAYQCPKCEETWVLADLVPKWDERFDYHGFGIDTD